MNRILIAEDVPQIARFLTRGLQAEGYTTTATPDGGEALELALGDQFDLMLLDLGLRGLDGTEVLARLRARNKRLPVIVLTARDSPSDIVANLDAGADDYVTKPFRLVELLARVRAQLRADHGRETFTLCHGDIDIDLRTREVTVAGRNVELSNREFNLAVVFLQHPHQVLSREQLLSHVWGYSHDPGSNVVEVYVRYLRAKIGADRIRTVRGAGYRLVDPGRAPNAGVTSGD